jgi:23S rRNA (uracil1939-C5)-methyltransferase
MNINDEVIVNILNLDDYGRGVAHTENYTIFVPNALANETVKIRITNLKSHLAEGEVVEYVSRSLNRIEPDCPFFNECGGCSLRHMSYEDTLKFKKDKVRHAIYKFAHLNEDLVQDIISGDSLYYRNKVEFQVNGKIGFYKKKSNKVVPVDECKLADTRINDVLKLIKHPEVLNSLTIKASKYTNDLMIIATGSLDAGDLKALQSVATSVYLNDKNIFGNDIIYEKIGDFVYTISPSSFFQVNTDMALKLYNGIKEKLEPNKNDKVFDLYCGTGTIGIYIANDVKEIRGIEINDDSIKDAKENAAINNISNISFITASVNRQIIKEEFKANKIIVDPPRTGLDANTIEYLNGSKAERIIYVSCDPITLSRDINLLKEYKVESITPYDMFPYSYHVESVVVLKLKNN